MEELNKLEKYLRDNGYKYRRIDKDNWIDTGYMRKTLTSIRSS